MNVEELIGLIKLGYKIKRPVLALSSPGIGKSSAVYQAASQLSEKHNETFSIIEVRASTSNPGELGDIKAVINGEVVDLMQGWVPTKDKVANSLCSAKGLIFVDEIADGTPTVQSALQQLLLDRRLGSAKLADGWQTVAASNRATDKAAAGRISTALINRCIVVTVEPDTDCFVNYALKRGFHTDVIAFARWKRSPWNFDPSVKNQNPAFCSPRSMEIMSDILKADTDPHYEAITGTIGDGIGSEFAGFLKLKSELPNLDEIIRTPDTHPVPQRMDIAVAVLYALMGRLDEKTVTPILTFFARNSKEIAMAAFSDVCKQYPELVHNRVIQAWMVDPSNVKVLSMGF